MKELQAGLPNEAMKTLQGSRPISYGVPGSPDLQGFLVLRGLPVYLGVEVKKEDGKQSEIQRNYEKMIKRFNGIYIVARDAEKASEQIAEIINQCEN